MENLLKVIMSAIIAGEGLGYFNNLFNSGVSNQSGQAALGQARENIFVNVATGNLVVQGQDEVIKGLGLGFGLSRTYNSLGNFDGDNNDQWRLGFISDIRLEGTANQVGSSIVRTNADGFEQTFSFNEAAGHYISKLGDNSHDIMIWQGNTALFKLDGREQHTETYSTLTNKLIARSDANGNATTINYSGSKPVSIQVSTKTGLQTTNLIYNNAGLLEKVETTDTSSGTSAVKVYYGYDDQGRLSSVTIDNTPEDRSIADNDVYLISYTYHGLSNRLESISQSDGTSLFIQYEDNGTGDYRVKTTTDGNGVITEYRYSANTTTVSVDGQSTSYTVGRNKQVSIISQVVDGQTQRTIFFLDPASGKTQTIIKAGATTRFTYDSNGNQTSVIDPEGRVISRTFSSSNLLLTETVDGNTTRFTYDGSNLRFVIAPDGSVTEYKYDAYGLRVSMHQFTVSKFNVDGLTSADEVTLVSIEQWRNALTNLQQQRTDYQYDFRGQLSAVTQYGQVDSFGNGAGTSFTKQFIYDYNGNLLQEISARSVETGASENYRKTYQYDGLGRLVQATDNNGISTSYLFDDANQRIITKYANGLWQTEVYDNNGQIISVQKGVTGNQSAFGATTYIRNAHGQIIAEQNELGARKYNFYDAANRLAATVDETGQVTRLHYNSAELVSIQISYENLVNTQAWLNTDGEMTFSLSQLDAAIVASPENDRRIEFSYNKAGQLRFMLDAEGYVTENRYSSSGLLTGRLIYDDIVTNLADFASTDNSSKTYRAYHTQYNKNGQVEFETDPEGYLTQYYYDAAGNNVGIRQYFNKGTPDNLTPSEKDKVSFTFYDAAGRVTATIDSVGKVTALKYDADGNLTEKHVYATAVRDYQLGDILILPAGEKRSVYYQYDKRGALILESASDGSALRYFYDDMGQVTKRQKGSYDLLRQPELLTPEQLQNDLSTERFSYDKLGRQTASLDANQNAFLAGSTEAEIATALNGSHAVHKVYDLSGNIISTTDALGYRTLFYYDEKQQLRFVVDAEGQITEYSYNSFGQREQTREYINQFSTTETAALTGGAYSTINSLVEAKRDDNDINTSQTFDRRGLLIKSTDAENYDTTFKYNAFTELVLQTTQNKSNSGGTLITRADKFIYDKRGLLTQQLQNFGSNSTSRNLSNSYDAFGRLESTLSASQQSTTFIYDEQRGSSPALVGNVIVTQTNVGGVMRQVISRYDMFGRLFQQIDAHGNTTTYSYNEADNTVSITTPDNVQQISTRDERGRVVEMRILSADNNLLQSSQYVYDANGNLIESWLNGVKKQSLTYDNNNQALTTTDANGKKLSTSYDGIGRITTTITDPDGLALTTSWNYQKRGTVVEQKQFLTTTDARYTITHFDVKGRVKEVIQLGQDPVTGTDIQLKTLYAYDRTGNKLSITEGAGSAQAIVTSYQYNEFGQLVSSTKGNEAPTEYIYNDKGQLVEQRTFIDQAQALNGTTINRYSQQLYRYNETGELIVKIVVNAVTPTLQASVETYEYDKQGRQVVTHRYSSFLTLTQSQTELSSDLAALDNAVNAFTSSTAKVSDFTVYDSVGRKTAIIDAMGATTLYSYDALGRVTEQIRKGAYADITTSTITSLKDGSLSAAELSYQSATSADARIANVYDDQGRLAYSLTDIDGIQAAVKQNHYDAAGNLVKTSGYSKTVNYKGNYSNSELLNTLSSKNALNDNNNRTNWFYYDKADRLRFSVDSSGAITETRYDNTGKISTIVQYENSLRNSSLSTQFNTGTLDYSQLQTQYQGNVFSSTDRVTQQTYDNAGRLISVKDAAGYTERYNYNSNGLLYSRIDKNNQEWRYSYDSSGRVTAEFSPFMSGIKTLINGSYQNVDGYAVKQYEYDATGNVTSISEGVYKGNSIPQTLTFHGQTRKTLFSYDVAGRQTKVTQPDADNAPKTWSVTEYNALGYAVRSYTEAQYQGAASFRVSQLDKVYNASGAVLYDVVTTTFNNGNADKANVTAYQYDALGNQTAVIRYRRELNLNWLNVNTNWSTDKPLSTDYINASKNVNGSLQYALQPDSLNDRQITFSYYANGQKKEAQESSRVFSYLDAFGSVRSATANPTTRFEYNAFGEVWKTSTLAVKDGETEVWLKQFDFYDNNGNRITNVDAQGYVSEWSYNSFGQISNYTEYAQAVDSSNFNETTSAISPAAANSLSGQNRRWSYEYDGMGRLTIERQSVSDVWFRNGNTLTALANTTRINQYDGLGQLTTATDTDGTSELQYDAVGNVKNSLSAQYRYVSNTSGEELSYGLENGGLYDNFRQVTSYSYDVFGNRVEIRRRANDNTSNGQFLDHQDDIVSKFTYNSRGQTIAEVDANGYSIYSEYDQSGNVTKRWREFTEPAHYVDYHIFQEFYEVDEEFGTTSYSEEPMPSWLNFDQATGTFSGTPNESGEITLTVKANIDNQDYRFELRINYSAGNTVNKNIPGWPQINISPVTKVAISEYKYDSVGQLLNSKVSLQVGTIVSEETSNDYIYNTFNELIRDKNGFYGYNSSGKLTKTNQYDNIVKENKYDLAGRVISTVSEADGETKYELDKLGRVVKVYQPSFTQLGEIITPVVRQEFDRWGNVTKFVDVRGYHYDYRYNSSDKVTVELKPEVVEVTENGNLQLIRPVTTYRYDFAGRLLETEDHYGNKSGKAYDALGNLIREIDALNFVSYFGYDRFGRQIAQQNAAGYITTATYNKLNQITETGDIRPTNGGHSFKKHILNTYRYDQAGNRISQTDARGYEYRYNFDARGNVIYSLSPEGVTKQFEYDDQGRKTLERYVGLYSGGNTHQNTWSYSQHGHIIAQNDLGGKNYTYSYYTYEGYDDAGNLTDHAKSTRLKSVTNEHGQSLTYNYYENGWLKSITDQATGAESEYRYNAAGQKIWERQKAVNAFGEIVHQITETNFDEHGRIKTVLTRQADSNEVVSKVVYSYDAVGNRRSVKVWNGYTGYIPDANPNPMTLLPLRLHANEEVTVNLPEFTDPQNDIAFIYVEGLPEGLTYTPNTADPLAGLITGSTSYFPDVRYLVVTVVDAEGNYRKYDWQVQMVDVPSQLQLLEGDGSSDFWVSAGNYGSSNTFRVDILNYGVGREAGWVQAIKDDGDWFFRLQPDTGLNNTEPTVITVRYTDTQTGEYTEYEITVDPEYRPDYMELPPVRINANEQVSLPMPAFTDADGDIADISIAGLPAGLTLNKNSSNPLASVITGSTAYYGAIRYLTVTVTDSKGQSRDYQWQLQTTDIPKNVQLLEGDGSSDYWVSAGNYGSSNTFRVDIVNYGSGRQAGWIEALKDDSDWFLRLVPDSANKQTTPTVVTLRYTDLATGQTEDVNVTIDPEYRPDNLTLPVTIINANGPVSLPMPAFTDADGDITDISITGLPAGLTYNKNSGSPLAGTITGTTAYSHVPLNIQITVTDSKGQTNIYNWELQTNNVQSAISLLEGDGSSDFWKPVGNFGLSNTFRVEVVNYGTGRESGWVELIKDDGDWYIRLKPDSANKNTTPTNITLRFTNLDSGGFEDFVVSIDPEYRPDAQVLPNTEFVVGDTVNLTVPTFSDADNDIASVSISGLPTGLSYNNGKITGSPTQTVSNKAATVTITDTKGQTRTLSWLFTVKDQPNTAPVIKSGAATSVTYTEGSSITLTESYFQSLFTDATPNGNLSIEFNTYPNYLTKTGGSLSGVIPINVANGTIQVRAVDNLGAASAWHTITLVTQAVSIPQGNIVLSDSNDFRGNLESGKPAGTISISVVSTHFEHDFDDGNSVIRMKASSIASGVVSGSAEIRYLLASGQTVSKTITVTRDYVPEFASASFTLNSLLRGVSASINLPTATDKNPDDVLRYVFSHGSLPAGTSFSATGPKLTGTPTTAGSGTFYYRVYDNNNDYDIMAVNWSVGVGNTAPVVTTMPARSTQEGSNVNLSLSGYFTDADGDALTYTATGLPPGLSLTSTGTITGRIPFSSSSSNQNYSISITARDSKGATVTGNFTYTVTKISTNATLSMAEGDGSDDYWRYVHQYGPLNIKTAVITSYGSGRSSDWIQLKKDDGNWYLRLNPTSSNKSTEPAIITVQFTENGTNAITSVKFRIIPSYNGIQSMSAPMMYSAETSQRFALAGDDGSSNTAKTSVSMTNSSQLSMQSTELYPDDNFWEPIDPTDKPLAEPEEYWFTYDAMNRVLIDGGSLINDQISIREQGQKISYNADGKQELIITNKGLNAERYQYNELGQLTLVTNLRNTDGTNLLDNPAAITSGQWLNSVRYEYDELNRVTKTSSYFRQGSVYEYEDYNDGGSPGDERDDTSYRFSYDYSGSLERVQYTSYDGDGRIANVLDLGISSTSTLHSLIRQGAQLVSDESYSGTIEHIEEIYVNRNAVSEADLLTIANTSYAGKYDAAGRTTGYVYTKSMRYYNESTSTPENFTWRFNTNFFDARTTYQEKQVFGSGTAGSGSFTPASTYSTYDVNGNRIAVEESKNDGSAIQSRHFFYSADGQLMRKYGGEQDKLLSNVTSKTVTATGFERKGAISNYHFSNGNYLGELDSDGNIFFKEQHFTAPDQYDNSSTERYTVRAGDTLQSIALLYYGSSDYWYIIASANGLSDDIPLQESTTLDIPARANTENRSDSFKPMELAQIIGDTTPTLPYVPAPSDAGCGAVGTIIMVAVAVALTVVTAGAAAVAMGGVVGAAGTVGAGAAVLGGAAVGGSALAGVAAAAIGGFVGSVGSQLVGKAMGNVDSFSLKGALASGLTAGITAGAGSALGVGGTANGTFSAVKEGATTATLTTTGRFVLGAATAASSAASNKLVGNSSGFSWASVAASSIVAGAGSKLPGELGSNNIAVNTAQGIGSAALGYGITKLVNNEGSWNFSNVASDAFGNALGNSFVANRIDAEKQRLQDERNAKIAQFSEALDKRNSSIANTAANAVVASTAQDAMGNVATQSQAQTDRIMQALAYNRELDFNELEAAQSAKRADQTLARIEASLEYSKLLEHDAASKYYDVARSGIMVAEYEQQHKYYAWRDKGGNGQGLDDGGGYTTFTLTSIQESQYSPAFGTEATNWVPPYGQLRQKVTAHFEGFNIGVVENANGKTYAHIYGSHAANNALGLPENFRRSNFDNYALNKAVLGAGSYSDVVKAQTYVEAFDPRTASGRLGIYGLGIDAGLEYADYKLGHGDGYKLAAGLTNVAIEGVVVTAGTVAAGAFMASLGLASLPILATGAILFGVGVGLGYLYDEASTAINLKGNLADFYRKTDN
jgi:YD repeat-containing protein